uniref:tail fiber domain-containing protein n=1 Tax=Flavobacterium sp. TaxID=239 RepID=UPI004049C80D
KINDETFLNPRVNGYFELYAGTSGFAFLQNQQDGSQPIAIFNSLDKSVEFFGDLDIPNFYNKTEVDTLFSNIDCSNYYTKTEIDTQLTDYATMTLIDVFYDKPYLDNQFSLKADVSTTITTDYLTTNYTDTVALTSGCYNKTETDTILLSYSTGSYVDTNLSLKADSSQLSSFASLDYLHLKCTDSVDIASNYYNKTDTDNLLANKVSTTGDVSISGNLEAVGRILIDGSHLYVQPKSTTSFETLIFDQSFSTAFGSDSHGVNVFGRQGGDSHLKFYNSRSNSNCNVLIDGNLDVGGGISTTNLNLTNSEQYIFLLVISNNGGNWFQGEYLANNANVGCLFRYKTSASTNYWWSGVWGSNINEFKIWFDYKGLSVKQDGSAILTGSLTQNSDASLKDNVEDVDLTDCMNMLENINVKTYTRNDMEEGNQRLGFIAQDVKAYLPDKFDNIIGSNNITDEHGENSKEIMTMDYTRMVCVLWKIVQNQNERIKALESK